MSRLLAFLIPMVLAAVVSTEASAHHRPCHRVACPPTPSPTPAPSPTPTPTPSPTPTPTPSPTPTPTPTPSPTPTGIPTLGAWSWCHLYNAGECEREAAWLASIGVKKWVVMGAGSWDSPTAAQLEQLSRIAAARGIKIHHFIEPTSLTDAQATAIVDAVKDEPGTGGYVIANEPEFWGACCPGGSELDDGVPAVVARRNLVRSLDPNTAHVLQGVTGAPSRYNGQLSVANVEAQGGPYIRARGADDWGIDAFPHKWGNTAYDSPQEVTYPLARWLAQQTRAQSMRSHFVIEAFDSAYTGGRTWIPTANDVREQRDCAIKGMTDGGQSLATQEVWLFYTDSMPRTTVESALARPYEGCPGT